MTALAFLFYSPLQRFPVWNVSFPLYFDDVFGQFFTVIDRGFLSPSPVYCLYGLDLLFTYEKHIVIQVINRQKQRKGDQMPLTRFPERSNIVLGLRCEWRCVVDCTSKSVRVWSSKQATSAKQVLTYYGCLCSNDIFSDFSGFLRHFGVVSVFFRHLLGKQRWNNK